jgi:hypothetical protein
MPSAIIIPFPRKEDELFKAYGEVLAEAIRIQKASLELIRLCVEIRNSFFDITYH